MPLVYYWRMTTDFEWDIDKAASNLAKHGISFEDASTAFFDTLSVVIGDAQHSDLEPRAILIGQTSGGKLIVIAHTDRGARIRLISARVATRKERRDYEKTN